MNNLKLSAVSFSMAAVFAAMLAYMNFNHNRAPASAEVYVLELQKMHISPKVKINGEDRVYLRVLFDRDAKFEVTPRLHIRAGEDMSLNSKITIDPKWIKDDKLEF